MEHHFLCIFSELLQVWLSVPVQLIAYAELKKERISNVDASTRGSYI